MLDLACGSGRHVRHLAAAGFQVTGVDRDLQAVQHLRDVAQIKVADLEAGPWPLAGLQFGAVLVTHYLWRPRWPELLACLAPGGVLVYETFCRGHETVGRPSRADFLLQPGELLRLAEQEKLRVIAYEDGFVPTPERFIQRMVAVREGGTTLAQPARHALQPGRLDVHA